MFQTTNQLLFLYTFMGCVSHQHMGGFQHVARLLHYYHWGWLRDLSFIWTNHNSIHWPKTRLTLGWFPLRVLTSTFLITFPACLRQNAKRGLTWIPKNLLTIIPVRENIEVMTKFIQSPKYMILSACDSLHWFLVIILQPNWITLTYHGNFLGIS